SELSGLIPLGLDIGPDNNLYVLSQPPGQKVGNVLRYGAANQAAFTVTLSSPSGVPVTVDFDTADVTANAGSDYAAMSGTLTFAPGVTSRTILVPTFDDAAQEETETLQMLLSNVNGATVGNLSATGTILDDGDIGNQAPTANAGVDQTLTDDDGTGSEVVQLNGSGNDPDGSIVAYEWTEGATVLGNTASISPSLSVGTHTLTLTVTDNEGATGSDTVVVTVNANQGPSADAGADRTVSDADGSGDQVVALIGSGSDPDGSIASYLWTEGTTVIGNTASISPSLSVGTHSLTLTVTDNGGATDNADVIVTIAANQGPTANAGDDKTVTDDDDNGSETVTLSGSGSDADGSIVTYQWTRGADVLGNTASISPTLDVGTHVLTLTVTDNGGATATDTVEVIVEAVPAGPNLSFGDVANVGSTWQTITLEKPYASMVVVATPRYNSGSGPGVVRIHNVTSNSFDVRVDNVGTSAFSGGVHYVAVEEGVYDETGQYKLEAVKYSESETSRKNGWLIDSASYQQAYTDPVVVGQVMSANDPDWSVFWASSNSRTSPPTSSQLNVGKHVAEDPDTTRATETIGYIVIEATQNGTIEGLPFVAGVGGDTVRGVGNGTYQYSYTAMPNAKAAILSTAGMDGGDGGWAVLRGTNPLPPAGGTIDLAIEEDQLGDSERNHTTEQVAYFVIDPPLPADPMDVNGDAQVTAADALRVINRLARTTSPPTQSASEWESLDVNQDGRVSVLDALVVINRLSRQPATPTIAPIASTEAVDDIFAATDDDEEEPEAVDQLLASTV
ncbi:MAG: dockerin type I domain-containing protein, partial [Planctomycetota bacterium]